MTKRYILPGLTARPELAITYRDPAKLLPYHRNARHHPRRQMAKLRKSIETFGWVSPLIIDTDNLVLCGNLRLATAINMGVKSVPVIVLADLTEGDRKALVLAENRISQEASWDKPKLKAELQALCDLGYSVELSGFDTLEIESTLSLDDDPPAIDANDDNVELDDKPPVTRLGDYWWVGPHRLLCGDARDARAYDRLLEGRLANLIFVDPPYAIEIKGNVSGHGRVKHENFIMGCGETSDEEFSETILVPSLKFLAANAVPGAIAFVCCDWRHIPLFYNAGLQAFDEVRSLITWAKTNAGNSGFLRPQTEFIYAWQVSKGELVNNFGLGKGSAGLHTKGRRRSNLWTYAGCNVFRRGRLEDLAEHATIKPKKLVADAIRDCSRVGDVVLDCFLGAGTTIVGAAITGRKGYGIELDPKFCDVALRRISEACGEPARLEGGATFDEIATERRVAG